MVALTLKHQIHWHAPLPIWAQNSSTGLRVTNDGVASYPSILRFGHDDFMQEMIDMMQHSPQRISEWLVQSETWREPMKTPEPVARSGEGNSLQFLLNRTKQLTDLKRAKSVSALPEKSPRQALMVSDEAAAIDTPIKLYHSTHQRHYLVSASLIVQRPDLPDQKLNLSQQEKATFVVRRLVPPEGMKKLDDGDSIDNLEQWDEYAYITTSAGPRWKRVDKTSSLACKKLVDMEQQLPLFPVSYQDDCAHSRVVLNGLIPVGKREKWMSAPVAGEEAGSSGSVEDLSVVPMSRARILFQTDVTEPWKILVEQAEYKKEGLSRNITGFETSGSSSAETAKARRTHRDMTQMASWYVLLDLAKFLKKELPAVWSVANQLARNPALQVSAFELGEKEIEFLDLLTQATLTNSVMNALLEEVDQYVPNDDTNTAVRRNAAIAAGTLKVSLIQALASILDWESDLESVETAFVRFDEEAADSNGHTPKAEAVDPKWPDFLFPLADPQFNGPLPAASTASEALESRLQKLDRLAELVGEILPEPAHTESILTPAAGLHQRDGWFVIRCVYERPHCGPLFPALVSEATRIFQMAPFFDPDAPSRPIRIPMPLDISPAGLRKYQKNTAFVISDMLCGKIKKIRKITLGDLVLSVLPWPFHKDLPNPGDSGPCKSGGMDFGMICSLSIPIVTLCALILLMIMVALFDLFFRWIPFLFMCLPIPGLKGKS
jgi:hypothetical protein